ncbi:hypothetical protein B0H11DRAFT_2219377 [Mycena galericulata]|nr:hypothetical protein B0H11DRAFT_2219377 [Mycena galericulata]
MAPGGKASKAGRGSLQQEKKAAKRREAALPLLRTRLFFRHPEAREKSRLRMAAKRLSQKAYRRKWDPPKTEKRTDPRAATRHQDAQPSAPVTLEEEEAVAHAALRTLSRKRHTSETETEGGQREPMTLTEIDGYASAADSEPSLCDEEVETRQRIQRQIRSLAANNAGQIVELKEQRRARLACVAAEKEEQELKERRQQELRWLVNSGPSAEDLYMVRGSLGVRAWLRELAEADT